MINAADLANFTGTERWYRHGLVRSVLYTEGVKYVAEEGGAYWLLDKIATLQTLPMVKSEGFQAWKLRREPNSNGAVLTCDDGNGNIVHRENIEFTDFPLPEITLWCIDNVILLPSEY